MNTTKKFWGRTPRPPTFKHNSFRPYYTHKYWKINIKTFQQLNTLYLHASSLQNVMQNMETPFT